MYVCMYVCSLQPLSSSDRLAYGMYVCMYVGGKAGRGAMSSTRSISESGDGSRHGPTGR